MFLRALICSLSVSAVASAADSPLTAALKYGEKRQYEQAVLKIHQIMPQLSDAEKPTAQYVTAVMSLKSAELYQSFYRVNIAALDDAYALLAKEKKEFRSQYIDFYIAEHLVEAGKCNAASQSFKSVLDSKKIDADHKAFGHLRQVECVFSRGGDRNAEANLEKVKATNAVIAVEKLAIKVAAGKGGKTAFNDWKKIADSAKEKSKSIRFISKSIAILAQTGEFETGLDILSGADLSVPDFEEASSDKTYYFYDLSLMRNLARFYLANAQHYFAKLEANPKYADQVKLYLLQAKLLESGDLSKRVEKVAFPNDATTPEKLKPLTAVYRVAFQDYKASKSVNGAKLVSGNEQQLDLLAEALRVCRQMEQKCEDLVALSRKNVGEAFGARFVNLNRAIGEYYLAANDMATAQTYLEYARDKSNKNKIEANEPMLLISLADVYRRSKTYSESLEILFEFAKYFPAVRQTQEAMQSIYSVDHKSAGDVRIF